MRTIYRFLLTVFVVCQALSTYAQTLSLSSLPNPLCTDTPISLTVSTTGAFDATNTLTLQVRSDYTGNQYTDIPFTQKEKVLIFQLPASLVPGDGRSFAVRVLSSAPAVESQWTGYVRASVAANVRLLDAKPAVSNAIEPFSLRFQSTGNLPITATMSDSSQLKIDTYNSTTNFVTSVPFYAAATGTYKLVSVQNICGAGRADGAVALTVNPVAIRTISATPAVVCRGGALAVSYSKASGSFGPANRFRIRLTSASPGSDPNLDAQQANLRVYTLDATEENGVLRAMIPDTLQNGPENLTTFRVTILTTDPVMEGSPGNVYVDVRPRASAEISTPGTTISYGETVALNVKFLGSGPFTATLSDGTVVSTSGGSSPSEARISLKPKQTTTYRIDRFQSACSTNDVVPSSTVVAVNPGLAVDSLLSGKTPVCEGQTARIRFSTNTNLGADPGFAVVFNRAGTSWTSAPVPARLEAGNVLAFTVPVLDIDVGNAGRFYTVTLLTTSPSLRSLPTLATLAINAVPTYANFVDYSRNTTLDVPGMAYLYVNTNGGGPYRLVATDGRREADMTLGGQTAIQATVFCTTTFTLRSVRNSCGVLTDPGASATVTIRNPTSAQIVLDSIAEYRCQTDSVTATFEPIGDFLPGNEFRVQMADAGLSYGYGWSDLMVVGRGTKSPIRFKVLPSSRIRIISTNPVVVSNEQAAPVGYKLTASIGSSLPGAAETNGILYRSILAGEAITLPISVNSPQTTGPYTLTYTDGTRQYTYAGDSWFASQEGLKPAQTTTYRLLGISNVCGAGTVQGTATFTVVPFRISTPIVPIYADGKSYAYSVCGGSSLSVPFITDVAPAVGTTFALQLASQQDSVFREIATGTSSPLVASLPTTQAAGAYWLRIVAKGTDTKTVDVAVRVQQPPTAIVSAPTGITSVAAGESFQPTVRFTGSSPWNLLLSTNMSTQFTTSPALLDFRPTKRTAYTLKAVTNACGYGTVSGEAVVQVKPTLSIQRQTYADDCAGSPLSLTYATAGDFGTDNQLTVELATSQGVFIRNLLQPKGVSGTLQLSLPGDLPAGYYQINLRASSPAVVASSPVYVTVKTPPIITLTGSTTINPGQVVYIALRNEKPAGAFTNEQITYRLSDGTTATPNFTGRDPIAVAVSPTQTTTYSLETVSGTCGVGSGRGTATVVVNPARDLSVTTGVPDRTRYCTGDRISVPFSTSGTFSASNQFTVQLIDSTGQLVRTLPTPATASPLPVTLTDDVRGGGGYRLRVVASDAGVNSGASPFPLQINRRATASFDTSVYIRQPGKPLTLTLRFDGQGPWYYTMNSDPGGLFSGTSSTNRLTFTPPKEGTAYSLVSVGNEVCGTGATISPATLRIDLLTGTEPLLPVSVWPNPTADVVQVSLPPASGAFVLGLSDANGQLLLTKTSKATSTTLSLSQYPAGMYLLTVDQNGKRAVYRVIRN